MGQRIRKNNTRSTVLSCSFFIPNRRVSKPTWVLCLLVEAKTLFDPSLETGHRITQRCHTVDCNGFNEAPGLGLTSSSLIFRGAGQGRVWSHVYSSLDYTVWEQQCKQRMNTFQNLAFNHHTHSLSWSNDVQKGMSKLSNFTFIFN